MRLLRYPIQLLRHWPVFPAALVTVLAAGLLWTKVGSPGDHEATVTVEMAGDLPLSRLREIHLDPWEQIAPASLSTVAAAVLKGDRAFEGAALASAEDEEKARRLLDVARQERDSWLALPDDDLAYHVEDAVRLVRRDGAGAVDIVVRHNSPVAAGAFAVAVAESIAVITREHVEALAASADGADVFEVVVTSSLPETVSRGASWLEPGLWLWLSTAGLVVGFLWAAAREARSQRLSTPGKIRRRLDLPVAFTVPHIDDLSAEDGFSVQCLASLECMKRAVSFLEVIASEGRRRTIAISSARAREGKSLVAAGWASAIARSGSRVLLVDADVDAPALSRLLGLEDGRGLLEAMEAVPDDGTYFTVEAETSMVGAAVRDALQQKEAGRLQFLPAGMLTDPAAREALFSPKRVRALVESFEEMADIILLDLPPLDAGSRGIGLLFDEPPGAESVVAARLAAAAGGCFLVVASRDTKGYQARWARDCLLEAGADVFGVILNHVDLLRVRSSRAVSRTGRQEAPTGPAD